MRYRDTDVVGIGGTALTQEFVTLTVWITFAIGCLFVFLGRHGKQRWLTFWGALTIIVCGGYFVFVMMS